MAKRCPRTRDEYCKSCDAVDRMIATLDSTVMPQPSDPNDATQRFLWARERVRRFQQHIRMGIVARYRAKLVTKIEPIPDECRITAYIKHPRCMGLGLGGLGDETPHGYRAYEDRFDSDESPFSGI